MGSLDHKNFGALHPQFWRARTASVASQKRVAGYMPVKTATQQLLM